MILGLGLVIFASWALRLVSGVHDLRHQVETRVGWLRALDPRAETPAERRQAVAGELLRQGALDAEAQVALEAWRTRGESQAALQLTQLVRGQTAEISALLGERWESISTLVLLALVLAGATLLLFVRAEGALHARDLAEAASRRVAEDNARLAAARLEDSEQTFAEVLSQLPDGVLIARQGVVVQSNGAAARLLGVEPDDRRLLELLGSEVNDEGPEPRAYDLAREHQGRRRILEVYGPCPIQLEGRPATLHLIREVTAARQLALRFRLNDRLAAVGTLAAGVAHEINNPLTFVGSNLIYAEELLRELSGLDPARRAELQDCLRDATEGARRVEVIAKDLKSFARPSDDLLGPVELQRVVESTINLVRSQLLQVQLIRDYQAVQPVLANEARLGQVFVNLLTNAAQAMPADRAQPRIEVRTSDEGGRVIVEVEDNGSGIAPEVKERIFDPFFTTKEIGQGTGLGLYVTHRILSELGASITVESVPGQGTTFRISLPAAPHKEQPAPLATLQ